MSPRVLKGTGIIAVVAVVVTVAVLMTPAGAHVTRSFRHLWRDHIKPKLATADTINDPTNPVDWTKLKGVPPDFADGVDDVGGGGGGGGGGGLHNVRIVTIVAGPSAVDTRGDTALCAPGETILGGGADLYGPGYLDVSLDRTEPTATGDGWEAGAHEHTPTGADWTLEVHAICATP